MAELGTVVALIKSMSGADPAVIEQAVTDWLDDHPEATTTVQDGSITEAKLAQDVLADLGEIDELKEAIARLQVPQANDHNIRIATPVQSAEIDPSKWVCADASVDGLFDVYDDVNNVSLKAVKVTSTNNGIVRYNLAEPINGNNYALQLSVLLDPAFSINTSLNGKSVEIVLYSDNKTSTSYRWEGHLQYETGNQAEDAYYARDGWWHMTAVVGAFRSTTIGGSFDITNITSMGFKIKHKAGTTRSIFIANMAFVPKMTRPGIVTIVDNFNASVPSMADYAYSKGVKLNLSIVPGFYDGSSQAPTSAPIEDLERIAEQGFHCIWNHTYEHLNFNNLNASEIADQINLAEEWMDRKGYQYSRGSDFISIPSARFNTASCTAMLKTNAKMIYHIWDEYGGVYIPYYPGLRQLNTTRLDSQENGEDAVSKLVAFATKALTYGGIAVIGFHGAFWERDDGVSWKAYIDAIAELEVRHYTLDEIYKGMWC